MFSMLLRSIIAISLLIFVSAEIPLWGIRKQIKPNITLEIRAGEYLLPKDLTPIDYKVLLIPYLEYPAEKNFTFDGSVRILLQVENPTQLIRVHSETLTIDGSSIVVKKVGNDTPLVISNWTLSSDEKQFLDIYIETSLEYKEKYTCDIAFTGILNDDLFGFYRSSYMDENNNKKWLATTFFQTTGARRAFPCFDEPIWRANFYLHIAHAPGFHVISNMPTEGAETPVNDRPELVDWKWTHFQSTVNMATYLVAFVVSDFESLTYPADNRFKVYSQPGTAYQGEYGNDLASKILAYLEQHTGHTYPLPKFDQIAVPDFIAGAMENWGLVTFREDALLFDEGVSTTKNKQRVGTVVTHELAHQWFGDLVSPKWWDDIWLNEGWATYYEYHALATVETDWQIDQQFIQEEMHASLRADGLENAHPLVDNVENPNFYNPVFDGLAYSKGGSIVRFLVYLLGEENFKAGMKQYFDNHAFGNANSEDLWTALQTAVPPGLLPEGQNLSAVMWTWTRQAGCPVIKVTRNYEVNTANLAQERFALKAPENPFEELWSIPVTMTTASAPDFEDFEIKTWLTENQIEIQIPANNDQWILVNVKQVGFYRVTYDAENWKLLYNALDDHATMELIHPINRGQMMDDALTLASAKHLDYTTALSTTDYLHHEVEYMPWATVLADLPYINDRMNTDTENREFYESYMRLKMDAVYNSVGVQVSQDDIHIKRWKRILVIDWACRFGHVQCNEDASQLFTEWKAKEDPDNDNPIMQEVKNTVYCAGMRTGNDSDYEFLMNRYGNSFNSPTELSLIVTALGCSSDTALLQRYLLDSITEHSRIRPQDSTSVFNSVYSNALGIELAFDFLIDNYLEASKVYGSMSAIGSLFAGISSKLNTQEHRDKLQAFRDLNEATLEEALPGIDSALVNLDSILTWHVEYGEEVRAYFAAKADNSAATQALNHVLILCSISIILLSQTNGILQA